MHFYYPEIPLSGEQQYLEWALLDTHDAQTDFYKHLRSVDAIRGTLEHLGGENIVARVGGNGVEASCTKPLARQLRNT